MLGAGASGKFMRCNCRFQATALTLLLGFTILLGQAWAAGAPGAGPAPAHTAPTAHAQPLLVLGPGDEVRMHVFGQPDMNGVMYVAGNGTIQVPLAGSVNVSGLSPSQAARKIDTALRKGQFLVNPQVTLTVVQARNQQVSVLGQVHRPGIYTIQSNTTLLDLLAQAGGETDDGGNTIYILRTPTPGGPIQRIAVNLRGLAQPGTAPEAAEITMKGGDQVYIPRASEFYVTGNVHKPGAFHLRQNMTVLQAVARAGGVTPMGSMDRIIIRRPEPGGRFRVLSARLTDKVEPNDVITVEERIF